MTRDLELFKKSLDYEQLEDHIKRLYSVTFDHHYLIKIP